MRYKKATPYLFILPMVLGLLIFRLGPIVASFFISFTEWNVYSSPLWIGIRNYVELINSKIAREVVRNTLTFIGLSTIGVMVISLFLATLVNQKIKGVDFFRGLFFMPVITSMVAVGLIWNWILSPRFGILNYILESVFHFTNPPCWLGDRSWVLYSLIMVYIWKTAGYQMVIFLAGLQSIPRSCYEAAEIDGANKMQVFFKITLPLLSPTTFFVLIISIINSFRTFEITYTMTQGGPSNASTTLAYYIYQNAFVYFRMGFASSLAYILLLLVGAITLVNFLLKRKWVKYQA